MINNVFSGTEWYGNWELVIASIVLASFIFFMFVGWPKRLDWRSFGLTEAFIISLFTEMFGIPLTIYIISSFLGVDIVPNGLTGHLWATLLNLYGGVDLNIGVFVVMLVSIIMIVIGLTLVIGGWINIYKKKDILVVNGFYSYVRHPQYLGLMIILTGFIIQWPTFLTLIMYPVLLFSYYRQALREEEDLIKRFGSNYLVYASRIPRFNIIKGLLLRMKGM
ncbi:MAG: methyltransferase family protein [Thermoprotei archaeon]|jgi:protein-S-isoprenylcysteine O-methyltransferase Ste14